MSSDRDTIQAELDARGFVKAYEERLLKRDGRAVICLVSSTLWERAGKKTPVYHAVVQDITERRRTEARLRTQSIAMASSVNGIAIADLDGNLSYVNPSCLNLWGYEDEGEVMGKSVSSFLRNGRYSTVDIKEVLASEGSWVGELKAERKGGRPFDVQASVSMVRDESGKPLCTMASFLDITEKKAAEESLKQSEEKFRLLFEKSADGILLLDEGGILDCNQSALAIMGCIEKSRLLGLHTRDLSPQRQPDGRLSSQKAAENRVTALKQGSVMFEWVFQRPDGSQFPAEVTLICIPFNGTRILYHVFRDISKTKRAEEDLKKTKKQLKHHYNKLRANKPPC